MAVTPIPHCVQFDVKMLCDGQTVENTFHVLCPSEPTATQIESMCSEAETSWNTNYKPLLSTSISLFEIIGTSLSGLTGARIDFSVDPPSAGASASVPLPLNSTLALKRHGAVRGRGMNGRIYWPQLNQAQVTGDQVTAAIVADMLTAAETLHGDIAAAGPASTIAVIAHKTGARAGTTTPLVGYVTSDNYVDSQRDRLPRHKRKKKHPTTSP